jgi:hypothetical protein
MAVTQLVPANQLHRAYVIAPQNMVEAMEYSKMIAGSCFCPANMRNKPGDVLVAIQMGAEVGLSPIQALQNIAVINSRPCLWGDATVAVVQGHPSYVRHDEWTEGSVDKGDMVAFCSITRKGSEAHVRSFSIEDAKRAKLWGKPGPWVQYPARMLQMRARAFAFRDKFADALKGIQIREEVEDYAVETRKPAKVEALVVSNDDALKPSFDGFMDEIANARNELVLKNIWDKIKAITWAGTDYLQRLADAKDCMKLEIKASVSKDAQSAQSSELALDDHIEFINALDGEVPNATV